MAKPKKMKANKKAPVKKITMRKATAKKAKAKPAVKRDKPVARKLKEAIKIKSQPKPKLEVVAKEALVSVEQRRSRGAATPNDAQKPLVQQVAKPFVKPVAPVVKKQVSTFEPATKERYSNRELDEFKSIINAKLYEVRKDYELFKKTHGVTADNGTDDTYRAFSVEDGADTLSRDEVARLAVRQEKFIKNLEDALLRIRHKTYGICVTTGRLISKERLRLVPHATQSIEAKQQKAA